MIPLKLSAALYPAFLIYGARHPDIYFSLRLADLERRGRRKN